MIHTAKVKLTDDFTNFGQINYLLTSSAVERFKRLLNVGFTTVLQLGLTNKIIGWQATPPNVVLNKVLNCFIVPKINGKFQNNRLSFHGVGAKCHRAFIQWVADPITRSNRSDKSLLLFRNYFKGTQQQKFFVQCPAQRCKCKLNKLE